MILARWLSYSPERFEKLAEAVTGSAVCRRLAERIEAVPLPDALVGIGAEPAGAASPTVARLLPDGPAVAYRHAAWGTEFRLDGVAPTTGDGADREVDWLLRRLRLINTRNRLTQLILLAVMRAQAAFLRSGEWVDLEPLPLSELARRLAGSPLPPRLGSLDVSLISRAVRGLTIGTPQGGALPLRLLLPGGQVVLRYRLRALLDAEGAELRRGTLERPRRDRELQREVRTRWGQRVSRRTVTATRQALGLPAWHQRAGRPVYPPPGFDFSPARPLTPEGVFTYAPTGPGVYEVAVSDTALAYPARSSPVIYVGSSRNLRNRLRARLHNHAKFGHHLGDGRLVFRFATGCATRLREAEADLLRAFRETHGVLPSYNLIMPRRQHKPRK